MSSKTDRERPLKIRLYKTQTVLVLSLLLVCVALAGYWPLGNNDFIILDDSLYITENEMVKRGLTIEGIQWAFRFNDSGYWHPLTWLAHMMDYELFGLNPTGHHFASLLIHLANTLLLFWILNRTTKCVYRSALVAMFFALHPLNVESVAWASERKNVLSTFFWFMTILSYTCYVRKQNIRSYIGVFACFVIGLMTKPMAVTLPFLLLLLDYWPLGRINFKTLKLPAGLQAHKTDVAGYHEVKWQRILLEKIPLLIISALSILLSILSVEKMMPDSIVPLQLRLANAIVSYISYIDKVIWPRDLAIFYPFPKLLLSWQIIGSFACLTGVSLLSIAAIRRRPYIFVGWFWFVGTLLPVSGIVQSGMWPSMADRWAYVPVIGLFVFLVWGIAEVTEKWPYRRAGYTVTAVTIFSALIAVSWIQIGHWANSITLFKHALNVTNNNFLAHNALGNALVMQGKPSKAIFHYTKALQVKPDYSSAHYNLGHALAVQQDHQAAIKHLRQAIRHNPEYAEAYNYLGHVLEKQGNKQEAIEQYRKALQIRGDYTIASINLGRLVSDP